MTTVSRLLCMIIIGLFFFLSCQQSIIPNLPLTGEIEDPETTMETSVDSVSAPPTSREEKIAWLESNAFPIRSLQPEDEAYSDLLPLKRCIGDARIVFINEPLDTSCVIHPPKTRLVKFLHREMGFDALAFESSMYDCHKAWTNIRAGLDARDAMSEALQGAWGHDDNMMPLFDYIGETVASRPLEVVGIDTRFTGNYAEETAIPELTRFLSGIQAEVLAETCWPAFIHSMQKFIVSEFTEPRPPEEQRTRFYEMIERVKSEIVTRMTTEDFERSFWIHFLENMRVNAKRAWTTWVRWGKGYLPAEYHNLRNRQMADILLWYAQGSLSGRKIIVWCSGVQACRHIDEFENSSNIFMFPGVDAVADIIWQTIGAQLYSIAFTEYDASEHVNGDLEDLMAEANVDPSYFDFRSIGDYRDPVTVGLAQVHGAWLREKIPCRAANYKRYRTGWADTIDCLFFLKM